MAEKNEVNIKISAEIDEFTKAIKDAQKQTKDFNDVLADAGKRAGLAFAALTGEAYLSLKAFGEQEKAVNSLSQSLKNQGIASDALVQKYTDQATALQALTGVNDEQIIQGQALLQSNLGAIEVTDGLTKAVLDLAAGTNSDLNSAFEKVAKTIGSSTNALGRDGIEIDANASKQEKLTQIIEKINKKYEGQAVAALQGVGSLKALTAAISDLQEEFGARLAPTFERVVKILTDFTITLQNNKGLIDFVVQLGAFAGTLTGLITTLSAAGFAITGLKVVAVALGTSLGPLLLGLAGISAALLLAANHFGLFQKKIEDLKTAKDSSARVEELQEKIRILNLQLSKPGNAAAFDALNAKLKETTAILEETQKKREVLLAKETNEVEVRKQVAATQALNKTKEQREELEKVRAHKEILLAEELGYSDKFTALLQERSDANIAIIKSKDAEEIEAFRAKNARKTEEILLQQEREQQIRDLTYQKELQLSQAGVELSLRDKQFTEDLAKEEVSKKENARKTELQNTLKYGKELGAIRTFLDTEEFKQKQQALNDLAALQNSSNATLKSIGKAAAVANIAIQTANAAINIFNGFSTIPYVGYALGIAGAAAAIAFGAEQTGKVLAAETGGIVPNKPGNVQFGSDSIPSLLTPGEIVVPTQNFDEVINSVSASRAGEGTTTTSSGFGAAQGGGIYQVIIGVRDNFLEVVEQGLLERRAIGVGSL